MKNKLFYIILALIFSMAFIGCRTKTKNVSKKSENIEYNNSEQSNFSNDTEIKSESEGSTETNTFENESSEFDTETITEFDIVKNDDGTHSSHPSKSTTRTKGKTDKETVSNVVETNKQKDSSKSNVDSSGNNQQELIIDSSESDKKVEWKLTTKQVVSWLIGFVILFFVIAFFYRYRKIVFPFLRV